MEKVVVCVAVLASAHPPLVVVVVVGCGFNAKSQDPLDLSQQFLHFFFLQRLKLKSKKWGSLLFCVTT